MSIIQPISVGKLQLNPRNYRIVPQTSQKAARDAIIAEQGKKLVVLAKDIVENGLNPSDLPIVIEAADGEYTVIEGNRRFTAISLLLDPERASGTPIHGAFVKLAKAHADSIPKVISCVVANSYKTAILWANRKHASGLQGAGTDAWSAMSKERADVDQGLSSATLDVVEFILSNTELDQKLRGHLEGSQFNITTLKRLVTTAELQAAVGFELKEGKICDCFTRLD